MANLPDSKQPPKVLNITPEAWADTPPAVRDMLLALVAHAESLEGALTPDNVPNSFQQLFDEVRQIATRFQHQQDQHRLLTTTFIQLRRIGFDLGLEELLDALQLLQIEALAADQDELEEMVKLLWCKSDDQQRKLDRIWKATIPKLRNDRKKKRKDRGETENRRDKEKLGKRGALGGKRPFSPTTSPTDDITPDDDLSWSALPISAPMLPPSADDIPGLSSDYPITRRQMIYYWRYLRFPVPDGPPDVLDVNATVKKAASQGFYLTPVYRRRHQNHAHLLLLVDQDGSMMPFHRFTRDIVDSARFDSEIQQVDVFYYKNVPHGRVFSDPHMTQSIGLTQVLEHIGANTSIFLISDMGAARSSRKRQRIQAMTSFLLDLQERSNLIAALNPMPRRRWQRTSAETLAYLVPMFPITADGFSNAIDVVRGIS